MIHLYVIDLQFKAIENAVFLKKAKKKVQESKLGTQKQVPRFLLLF